mgnify:CR=1 FL=1
MTENPFFAFVRRYHSDPEGFVRDVLKCEPHPWQAQFLRWICEGERRISVASGHGVGKALSFYTVLDTPTGPRRWGDLKPGDFVFGSDGAPTEILATYPQGVRPIYRVWFDDGSCTLTDTEHLWRVKGRQQRRKGGDWVTLSTAEIMERGVKRPNGSAQARQWEIPVQGAAQFPHREVSVDPYWLGVWLGDGGRDTERYGKPYHEVCAKLRQRGLSVRCASDGVGHSLYGTGIHDLSVNMEYGNARYVPEEYKYNDVETRRQVLCGLLDTDGEAYRTGKGASFSSASRQLVEDVVWLARSLGGKAHGIAERPEPFYYDEDGRRMVCQASYRVNLRLPFNPFAILHKQNVYAPDCEERYRKRWIDSIEYSHEEKAMCIRVAAKDSLYLANDFIVTHNSTIASWAMLWYVLTRYPVKVVVTAPTSSQLYDALFGELKHWVQELPEALSTLLNVKGDRLELVADPNAAFISARTSRAEQPEALQGIHSRSVMLVADEASGVPEAVFEAASGSMSGHNAVTILLGNPTKSSGLFYETHHRLKGVWKTMEVSCFDSPLVSEEYIQEQKERYGEDSNAYRVRVLGKFPLADVDAVIAVDLVDSAMKRDVVEDSTGAMVWGVDVARYGSDSSALAKRRGAVVPAPVAVWKDYDIMQVTGAVKAEYDACEPNDRPEEILVDSVGMGSGVADRLRELGLPARDINVAEVPAMKASYYNLRAELWFKMREWFQARGCSVAKDDHLFGELTAPRYEFLSTGKAQVETKEKMKRRGVPSPNRADALMLTFASNAAIGMYGIAAGKGWNKPIRRHIPGQV